jgi:hypothetical protein
MYSYAEDKKFLKLKFLKPFPFIFPSCVYPFWTFEYNNSSVIR